MSQQGLYALVNHPDNTSGQDMLSSGCDDRECRVLLPKGVRIDQAPHVSSWGIRMELVRMDPYTMHTRTITLATFHLLLISHIRNFVRLTFHHLRMFHIRRLPQDGKGRRFNFPGQTYPDPPKALTQRVSQPFCTVPITFTRRVSQSFCRVPRCSPEASRYV